MHRLIRAMLSELLLLARGFQAGVAQVAAALRRCCFGDEGQDDHPYTRLFPEDPDTSCCTSFGGHESPGTILSSIVFPKDPPEDHPMCGGVSEDTLTQGLVDGQ